MNKILEKIIFLLINVTLSCGLFLSKLMYESAVILNPFHSTFCVFNDEWLIITIIIFFLLVFLYLVCENKSVSFHLQSRKIISLSP